MAFTKVLGPGIHTLSNITSHNIHSSGIVTAVSFVGDGSSLTGIANTDFIVGTAITMGTGNFTGDLTVGGVLTYEDVKNVDSIGVVTARNGIDSNSDISIISTGDANLNLVADTGNNNESSVPTINFTQDGGVNLFKVGVEGLAGGTFTGSTANTPYILTTTGHGGVDLDFGVSGALRMKLTTTALVPATNNVEYLGTNLTRWARLYTNGIYDANVKRFGVTSSGFEGYGTQFKFSDAADCNVIINADTDNNDEGHTPNLAFMQDGATNVLNIGVEGNAGDKFAGSTGNFAYVQVGGHNAVGLEIATGNTSTKRLTIDTNGNIIPGADSTYNIGSNSVRFANIYADNLYGAVQNTTFTSAVTIDVNGNDNGETTLFTLDNYVSDLSNEYTWIDFTFRDSNANSTPQVKIGAQVMDDSSTGQQGEGAGDFVVKCAVDTASNTMTEMFRCSHDTKITSVHHYPQSDSNFDLGTNTVRWRNVYADTLYGDGSNLTGISGVTINNNADNRIITGSGTAATLNGESNLTFDGTNLLLNGKILKFDNVSSTPSASGNVHIYAHDTKLKMCGGSGIQFEEGGFTRWHITSGALHPHGTTYNNLGNSSNRVGNAYIQTSVDLIDGAELRLGNSDDLQIYHSTFNYIESHNDTEIHINAYTGGSAENMAKFKPNGAVELYHNGSLKLDTRSSGVGIGGDLFFVDSSRIYMGSSNDFHFFHDGSNSHIVNATGNIVYRSDTHHFKDKDNGDTHAKFNHDGSVELYNDNSKKLETTSSGVHVTGSLNVTTTMHIPDGLSLIHI